MPKIWEQRRAQTQCFRGHPYDEANTYWYERNGYRTRICRICNKERRNFREKLYGLAREHYARMLTAQGGRCALCGRESGSRALAVDHDHATGRIRGLLCSPCNTGIGGLRDDPEMLRRAIAYLELHAHGHDVTDVAQEDERSEPHVEDQDRELLLNTADMLVDVFSDDAAEMARGTPFDETLMATHLPISHAARYDVDFVIRFAVAASRVCERLANGAVPATFSVVDELAVHAIFTTAVGLAEDLGDLETAKRLADFEDWLLPDTDFLFLFEKRWPIRMSVSSSAGLVNLRFEEWFRPFGRPTNRAAGDLN